MTVTVITPTLAPSTAVFSQRRILVPWYAIEWLNSLSVTLLTYCAYFMAKRHLNATPVQCLWLSAGWGFTYIFFSLMAGHLSDRWGPRVLVARMSAGSALTALLGIGVVYYPNLWLLFAAMTAFNFTSTMLWPALESVISRCPVQTSLSTRMTFYNLTWALAAFLAVSVADAVMALGWPAIFIIPSLLSTLALIITWRFALPDKMLQTNATDELDLDDAGALPEKEADHVPAHAETLLYMAWVANALAYVAINTLIPVMPTLTAASAEGYASAGSLWSLARFAGFGLFWWWARWHYKVHYMLTAHTLLTVSFCVLLLFPHLAVLLSVQVLFGLATAFIYASSLYYAMHISSGGGGHAGIHEALIGAGICLGPTVGALAGIGANSLAPVAYGVTTILLIGGITLFVLGRRVGR